MHAVLRGGGSHHDTSLTSTQTSTRYGPAHIVRNSFETNTNDASWTSTGTPAFVHRAALCREQHVIMSIASTPPRRTSTSSCPTTHTNAHVFSKVQLCTTNASTQVRTKRQRSRPRRHGNRSLSIDRPRPPRSTLRRRRRRTHTHARTHAHTDTEKTTRRQGQ